MSAIVRATDTASPLSDELQDELIEALRSGLKPRHVALRCTVAPATLRNWLEMGSKRDALQPYRGFVVRWTREEAMLMQKCVEEWRQGSAAAYAYLQARWPTVWGKDAEPDFEPLRVTGSNADELAQFEAILEDPAAYGVFELFAKHRRLRPDGT